MALNHDYDEQNMTTETVFVGPEQRPVTVWRLARDNEPDRLPDEGASIRSPPYGRSIGFRFLATATGPAFWMTNCDRPS